LKIIPLLKQHFIRWICYLLYSGVAIEKGRGERDSSGWRYLVRRP